MPATKRAPARTPRTGRPREKSGTHRAVMFRWPVEFIDQLHEIAEEEERSINTVAFRLIRKGVRAEGREVAVPEAKINTAYDS
ncbi:MAG TPA: Arc family DNA-binding protein [Candidatus Tectomicrobia bacterium]